MLVSTFVATNFLGAFLLFQIQPLIGKFILPWFGGAASVWTICMLFFQVVLLLGYAYAHSLSRITRPYLQVLTHLCVLAGALTFIPIAPSFLSKPADVLEPTWPILNILFSSIGGPFLVIASTSPLLQAWFHRASPSVSPYRLYALSNVGSLLALISFPFLFEPLFERETLLTMWSVVFVVFAVLFVCCGLSVWRLHPGKRIDDSSGICSSWAMWILLPAAGSTMLLATTNKICQDVGVVPFLWIIPLALYLLSFVITFDSPRWYRREVFLVALAILMAVGCRELFKNQSLMRQIVAFCSLLFVYCMVCHGEVYRLKPHPNKLTSFYMCIAVGGALGGVFVALVAPVLFNNFLEFHFGMLLAPLLVVILLLSEGQRQLWKLAGGMTLVLALVLAQHIRSLNKDVLARTRNFYGVLSVLEQNEQVALQHRRSMYSGDIVHGEQFLHPLNATLATTYYGDLSGVGRALRSIPAGNRRVGAIGLGIGTIAAYAHRDDQFRFYEINPESRRLAEKYFTYLSRARGKVEVVLGDGRVTLENEPQNNYDLLVIDAFSGDSIPVHLLTREAVAIYLHHVKPNGGLAFHITNRHLDLFPVLQKLADHYQLNWVYIRYDPSGSNAWLEYTSVWMILSRDQAFLDDEIRTAARTPTIRDVRLWTDDFASVLPLLKIPKRVCFLMSYIAQLNQLCVQQQNSELPNKPMHPNTHGTRLSALGFSTSRLNTSTSRKVARQWLAT